MDALPDLKEYERLLLFILAFILLSFCNSKCYCQFFHFCIHRSVRTEFWTRTC